METRIPLSPMFWNSLTTLIRKARSEANPLSPTDALLSKTNARSAVEDEQPGTFVRVGGTVKKISVAMLNKFLFSNLRITCFKHVKLEMARAVKRPANEPLTGLVVLPLTAQFYFLFLTGPQMNRLKFSKSL